MPNGFSGSPQDFERLEAPLRSLDPALELYAQLHGFEVSRNYHDWPERTLERRDFGIRRLIQLFLDADRCTFSLHIGVYRDRFQPVSQGKRPTFKRYSKDEVLMKTVPIEEIRNDLRSLLDLARSRVEAWTDSDLKEVSS